MSITVTFTFDTREEAAAFLAGTTVSSAPVAIDVQPIPAAATESAKPAKPAKPAKSAAAKKNEAVKVATIDDVRAALNKYNSEHGLQATIELLTKHGKAPKITSVDPARYAAVLEACAA